MAFKLHHRTAVHLSEELASFAENFLNMCFAVPCEDYKINPVWRIALDKIFILHADHEQNASTSTVRIAGSSGANRLPASPPASPACGAPPMAAPRSGTGDAGRHRLGRQDSRFHQEGEGQEQRSPPDGVRAQGLPRTTILAPRSCRRCVTRCWRETGHGDDPMLKVRAGTGKDRAARLIIFIERKLYPNVDFYSGITLKAMGFPTSMFTVLFAVARTVGWISQWKRNDRGSATEDRPPAAALYRRHPPRLRRYRQAQVRRR